MSQRLYATLTTVVALTGTIRQSERLTAPLGTSVPARGTIVNTQRLNAQISTIAPLRGAVVNTQRLQAGLVSTQILRGHIRQAERLYGGLTSTIPLTGFVRNSQRLAGSFSPIAQLFGTINHTERLYGGLSSATAIRGTLRVSPRLVGALSTITPLRGTIRTNELLSSVLGFGTSVALRGHIRQSYRLYGNAITYVPVAPYDNVLVDTEAEIEDPKSDIPVGLSSTIRPDALSFDNTWAATYGPEVLGATTTGILGWCWYVRVASGAVKYARSNTYFDNWEAEGTLFTYTGVAITELDVAYDVNGRIVVVAERPTGTANAPQIWVYWYKPSVLGYVFEMFDDGRTPRVVLDDPNDPSGEVHFAYVKDGVGLVTRRQSELYATAHATSFVYSTNWYLEEFARNRGNRLTAILSQRRGDRYLLDRTESVLYPVYPRDSAQIAASVLATSTLEIP